MSDNFVNSNEDEKRFKLRSSSNILRLQRGLMDVIKFFYNETCLKKVVVHGNVIEQHGIHTPFDRPYILIFLSDYYRKHLNDDFIFNINEVDEMVNIDIQKTNMIHNTRVLHTINYYKTHGTQHVQPKPQQSEKSSEQSSEKPPPQQSEKPSEQPQQSEKSKSQKNRKTVNQLVKCKKYGRRLGVKTHGSSHVQHPTNE